MYRSADAMCAGSVSDLRVLGARCKGPAFRHIITSASIRFVRGWHLICRTAASNCLGPSWPGSSSRGACRVRATILLRLPPDCWLFIQEMRSTPVAEPLSGDIQTILDLAPRIELRPPIPEARFVASMSRLQVEALHRWLHALLDELSPDDPRWPTCLHCIGRVAGSLRLSQL
jgi:hypothetical protein